MTGKPHNDLMKSIRQYCEYLAQGNFSHGDFFIESTYLDGNNQNRPCFLLTRKGCDMVANKMTGEKVEENERLEGLKTTRNFN